jgi:hypothetical protein
MLFSLLIHVYVSMFTVSYYFKMLINSMEEKFEYTEGVIRSRKSQKDNTMTKTKKIPKC